VPGELKQKQEKKQRKEKESTLRGTTLHGAFFFLLFIRSILSAGSSFIQPILPSNG